MLHAKFQDHRTSGPGEEDITAWRPSWSCEMSGLIRPKIERSRPFMPVLVTSNFDDDLIKNERASMETPFSHYKTMGNFLDAQGQLTP